jgi:hypothetical protein
MSKSGSMQHDYGDTKTQLPYKQKSLHDTLHKVESRDGEHSLLNNWASILGRHRVSSRATGFSRLT